MQYSLKNNWKKFLITAQMQWKMYLGNGPELLFNYFFMQEIL